MERSLSIVPGYQPQFHSIPWHAQQAGLTTTIGLILSTYRADSPDMVLDHALWLACMRAVTAAVTANRTEVYEEVMPRWFERWRKPQKLPLIGSLEDYTFELRHKAEDARLWQQVDWYRDERLMAIAVCEPWYKVGGPPLYHDSYATCLCVESALSLQLISAITDAVREAGGQVEEKNNCASS